MSSSLHVQPTATSRLTANSASAAAAAAAARAQDDFTAAPDEVEYDAFLQKETERVIKEEVSDRSTSCAHACAHFRPRVPL